MLQSEVHEFYLGIVEATIEGLKMNVEEEAFKKFHDMTDVLKERWIRRLHMRQFREDPKLVPIPKPVKKRRRAQRGSSRSKQKKARSEEGIRSDEPVPEDRTEVEEIENLLALGEDALLSLAEISPSRSVSRRSRPSRRASQKSPREESKLSAVLSFINADAIAVQEVLENPKLSKSADPERSLNETGEKKLCDPQVAATLGSGLETTDNKSTDRVKEKIEKATSSSCTGEANIETKGDGSAKQSAAPVDRWSSSIHPTISSKESPNASEDKNQKKDVNEIHISERPLKPETSVEKVSETSKASEEERGALAIGDSEIEYREELSSTDHEVEYALGDDDEIDYENLILCQFSSRPRMRGDCFRVVIHSGIISIHGREYPITNANCTFFWATDKKRVTSRRSVS